LIELLKLRAASKNAALDDEILQELSKEPLFTGFTASAAVFMRDIIEAVLIEDMQSALDGIFHLSEDEIPDEYAESFLLLAQNLCAVCEYAEGWVLFNKNYIRFLLDDERPDEAMVIISDLEEVLPGDNELKSFRDRAGVTKVERVAIFGVSKCGEALAQRIEAVSNNKYRVTHFCDRTGKYVGEKINGAEIVSVEKLAVLHRTRQIDKLIVAFSGYTEPKLSMIYRMLKTAGITKNVFTVPPWFYDGAYDFVHESLQPFDGGAEMALDDALIEADMSREVLDFIMPLSNLNCNSSCRSCLVASPLTKPGYISLQSYRDDITRLRELYWHVCRFRISGGEPLLHPELAEMVKITREAFPITGLAIQTNGLLLLKDDGKFDELLEVMHKNRCGFQVSTYQPIIDQRDKLGKILSDHGVQWHWGQISGKPVESFWIFRMLEPVNDMEHAHRTCFTDKHCHTLYNGYVYPCFLPGSSEVIEKHFNVKFEDMAENMDKMRMDIHNTEMDGWEISRYLTKPTPMCRYCCFEQVRKVKWEQCQRSEAKLEDFVLV